MESAGIWEQKPLFNELKQGRELAKQLQMHLDQSYSEEARKRLVEDILSSFDKALSMVKCVSSDGEARLIGTTPVMSDSPRSDSGSPNSEDSDRRDIYKKRKTLPRWTEQIRISSGTGHEGPLDDGYSWRKYGQKDILGAKYPRGYYRCTHRNVQGCLATKQVQRSDEDPSIFDITYRGRHTCIQASHTTPAAIGSMESLKQEPIQDELHNHHYHHIVIQEKIEEQSQQQQKQAQELLFNFRTSLKVKTNELDSDVEQQQQLMSSAFSFPSNPFGSVKSENHHIFSPPTVEHYFPSSLSPSFISPATSESNYFSVSPCRVNSLGGQNLQTSDSDLAEIISAVTSGTNSPIVDLDLPMEFDPNFPFNSPEFFPDFDTSSAVATR